MTTGPARALEVATYLLVYDGLAALYLGGLLSPAAALGVGVAVSLTWWQAAIRERLRSGRGLGRALLLTGLGVLAADLVYLAGSVLDGLVHVLVFLVLYRLWARCSAHDTRDVGFLAFFMLVAASPATVGVGFLFVFIAFLVLGIWMMMLRHLVAEAEARRPAGTGDLGLGRSLLGLSLAASLATLAITATLFFVIPRVGQAGLPFRAHLGRMVSGFSDRVELGAFGEIETDDTVAMRVRVAGGVGAPEALANLRWRGVVLDAFDGRAWTAGVRERITLRRGSGGGFAAGVPQRRGPIVTQEIFLEPIGSDVIFGAPRMLRLTLRASTIALDEMGGVTVAMPAARLHYVVESELERTPAGAGDRRRWPAEPERPALVRYLQLPPLPARVGDLAREVTAGSAGSYEAALRLTQFLSARFRYTTALDRRTDLDPVDEFLFVRRSGNCEYFAAALAVMLRTVGIPARVVNGFQRGEWNPYGRYFMVRLRDAHSWVEAYVGEAGWVTLDPSPRGGPEVAAAPGTVALYLDALRLRWYRYVINWSLRDQVSAAISLQRVAGGWRTWPPAPAWRDVPRAVWGAAGLVALGAVLLLVGRGRARVPSPAAPPVPAFYRRALAALRRRGLAPAAGETAREFALRVHAAAPAAAAPLARLTEVYERVRFGGIALTEEELLAAGACVTALRRLPGRRGRRTGAARLTTPPVGGA